MKKPSLLDDLRETRANWHDPAFRKGFIPAFLTNFLIWAVIGGVVVYILARATG